MNSYQRSIRDHLRDDYHVPEVHFFQGGNHPRAEFTYASRSYTLTLHRAPGSRELGASTLKMKLRDIRRLLGDPPAPAAATSPRKLENMMTIQRAHETPRRAMPSMGHVALYRDAGKTGLRVRFYPPEEAVAALGTRAVAVTRASPDSWQLTPDPARTAPALRREGTKNLLDGGSALSLVEGFSDPFGVTPAEYLAIDGTVLVRLLTDQIKPVAELHNRKSAQDPAPWLKRPEVVTAVAEARLDKEPGRMAQPPELPQTTASGARWVEPPPPDPLAVLRAIAEVEHAGTYALVRLAEGGGWAWKPTAPWIKLEDAP